MPNPSNIKLARKVEKALLSTAKGSLRIHRPKVNSTLLSKLTGNSLDALSGHGLRRFGGFPDEISRESFRRFDPKTKRTLARMFREKPHLRNVKLQVWPNTRGMTEDAEEAVLSSLSRRGYQSFGFSDGDQYSLNRNLVDIQTLGNRKDNIKHAAVFEKMYGVKINPETFGVIHEYGHADDVFRIRNRYGVRDDDLEGSMAAVTKKWGPAWGGEKKSKALMKKWEPLLGSRDYKDYGDHWTEVSEVAANRHVLRYGLSSDITVPKTKKGVTTIGSGSIYGARKTSTIAPRFVDPVVDTNITMAAESEGIRTTSEARRHGRGTIIDIDVDSLDHLRALRGHISSSGVPTYDTAVARFTDIHRDRFLTDKF